MLIKNALDIIPDPEHHWPNWVLGNHDKSRVCSRLGDERYADVMNTLLLLLPGELIMMLHS